MKLLSLESLAEWGARPALVDGESSRTYSFETLARAADAVAARLAGPRSLVACGLTSDVVSVASYLGALAAGHVVLPYDASSPPDRLQRLRDAYQPNVWLRSVAGDAMGYETIDVAAGAETKLRVDYDVPARPDTNPSLALLLLTSGSTGSPKLVRLSYGAVESNARSIVRALAIDADDIAITVLPLHYSYGLSVLHSHLSAGATTVLSSHSVLTSDFWRLVHAHRVSSLSGVPYTYEMLRRARFSLSEHPCIRTMTQAGGRMGPEMIRYFHEMASEARARMYVMYGQTEATARISIAPWESLPDKIGSVGLAIPGGRLSIHTEPSQPSAAPSGEVIFEGPSVMLGYAESVLDLANGDELGGVLSTGDIGYLDEDEFLYITGRMSRIAKIFGLRVDMDDLERRFLPPAAAAMEVGGRIAVFGSLEGTESAQLRSSIARSLGIHQSGIEVRAVESLPKLSNGKIDYEKLRGLV